MKSSNQQSKKKNNCVDCILVAVDLITFKCEYLYLSIRIKKIASH